MLFQLVTHFLKRLRDKLKYSLSLPTVTKGLAKQIQHCWTSCTLLDKVAKRMQHVGFNTWTQEVWVHCWQKPAWKVQCRHLL